MQSTQFNQYKTLILQVGFDEKRHGYINPCQDVLDDKMPEVSNEENEETYRRKQFFPSDPFDVNAGLCNIMLKIYLIFTSRRDCDSVCVGASRMKIVCVK